MADKKIQDITLMRIRAKTNNRVMKTRKRVSRDMKRDILVNFGILVIN